MAYTGGRGIAGWVAVAASLSLGVGGVRPAVAEGAVAHVIVVSVDGLRPDAVTALGPDQLPNLFRLRAEGSFTDNARTDFAYTITLPNHAGILTGRPASGADGHGLTVNIDVGGAIHGLNSLVPYVASVFDVVHDHGGSTALYASKPKFALFDRSWDTVNGADDPIGIDDGRDKIGAFVVDADTDTLVDGFVSDMAASPFDYSLVHLADPDVAGHASGWMSPDYLDAVRHVDGLIGRLTGLVEGQAGLAANTVLIVTSDHGGTSTGHEDPASPDHFTVPFYVWGGPVGAGDLYAGNPTSRRDPLAERPGPDQSPPPIRNGDAANLALALLGLPAVRGSQVNPAQDLAVTGPTGAAMVGVFDPGRGLWRLQMPDGGFTELYFGIAGDMPLLGDWDCDGTDTPGVYRQSSGEIFLSNRIATGVAEVRFYFGGPGDYPVAGDWNGDGCDSVAVYRAGEVFVTDSLATAPADFSFRFGGANGVPFAGDFDGSGSDSLGWYDRSSGRVVMANVLGADAEQSSLFFGRPLDLMVAGDWNRDGTDTVGVFRPEDGRFYLANANQQQAADLIRDLGRPRWLPVAGVTVPGLSAPSTRSTLVRVP